MAVVTNRHGAPDSLVEFAKAPHYDSGGSDFTVTQLIDSPRIRILRAIHSDEIEDDVYENIFRLVGTAIHSIAEQHSAQYISEERIHLKVGEIDVSGAIDVMYQNEDGTFTLGDYKFTSVQTLRFPEKWEEQLNFYAHLVEKADPDHAVVERLEVYAILRDWSWRSAGREQGYPRTPGVTVQVELWPQEKRQQHFKERLNAHIDADIVYELTDKIPPCTKTEMWEKDPTFAVKKKNRVRAVRVLPSMEEATEYMEDKADNSLFIERREGERTRCGNFCDVAKFCDQWKAFNSEEG